MDMASQHVVTFLESLQDAMQRLGQIHTHYVRRGTAPARPFLVLSGRPFSIHEAAAVRGFRGDVALGLTVRGADGREYELAVDALWAADGWTITTEAWVEAGTGGQDLLRNLPERSAVDLSGCIRQLGEAIGDLLGFGDLVPGEGNRA
jgi:hypothetical protein